MGVEGLVGGAVELAEPVAQVVVDLAGQVLRAVTERLLPPRRLGAQSLRSRLGPLEVLDDGPGPIRVGEDRAFGGERRLHLVEGEQHRARRRADGHLLGLGDDRFVEEAQQGRVARLLVDLLRLRRQRLLAQQRRHRQHLHVAEPGRREVPAIELRDAPPRWVEVGLRHHADHRRAPGGGEAQHLDLHRRQLLGGVADEDHDLQRCRAPPSWPPRARSAGHRPPVCRSGPGRRTAAGAAPGSPRRGSIDRCRRCRARMPSRGSRRA